MVSNIKPYFILPNGRAVGTSTWSGPRISYPSQIKKSFNTGINKKIVGDCLGYQSIICSPDLFCLDLASCKSIIIFFPFLVAAIIGELFFFLTSRPRLIVQIWTLSIYTPLLYPILNQ